MSILVLDVGSSSVRALLLDDGLHPIAGTLTRRDYTFAYEPVGAAQGNVELLCELLEACIDEVLRHPAATTISAVGMATFAGNLLGVDGENLPLTPIYTYADSRSSVDLAALCDEIDVAAAYHRTGCPHHTAYHPARLRWLYRTLPETVPQVVTWLDFGTYCYRRWFGRQDVPCSYSIASWSGLLNRHTLSWDAAWLEMLKLSPEILPPLADFDAVQTGLSREYGARWSILRDVPFYLAVGDGAAANIGSGAFEANRAMHPVALTVGTTAAIRTVVTQDDLQAPPPLVPPGLWGYRVSAQMHLIGGALTEGGSIYAWARRLLGMTDTAIEEALVHRAPDAHGLTVLPLLAGERSPGYIPSASGTIHGLTLATDPLDIVQALMESVALRLRLIFHLMEDTLLEPGTTIYAGGGALESAAWVRIIADVFGRPLYLLDEIEVTARGVGALILGTEHVPAPQVRRVIEPNLNATTIYRAAAARQAWLYGTLYGTLNDTLNDPLYQK